MEWNRRLVMIPGPTNVPERVMNAMIKPLMNHRSPDFTQLNNSIVEKTRKVFGTQGDIAIFSSSGTGGVEAAITNLIRPNDKVIVAIYGEFGERMAQIVEACGARVIPVEAPPGSIPSIARIKEAFHSNPGVKALCTVANDTSTGTSVNWLEEGGKIASNHNSFFVVDAVSNLGGDPIYVDKMNIDICASASQKCLAGPPGLALLSVSKKAREFITKNPIKFLYFNIDRYFKFQQNGETPFTPALTLYYALDEALSIVLEEGLERRFERHRKCARALRSAIQGIGIELFGEKEALSNTVVGALYPPGVDDKAFRGALAERFGVLVTGGFGNLRGKLFRIGSMGMVNSSYILTTVSALASCFNFMGQKVDVQKALELAQFELEKLQ